MPHISGWTVRTNASRAAARSAACTIILLGTVLMAAPPRAGAQDTTRAPADTGRRPADTTRSTTLQAVVVTATRSSTKLSQMALHASVIDQHAIHDAPARTLDQLLRNVSGMNMSGTPFYATDPTGQQTKMRGVTNSKVLMMVDGIPIHDPFYSTTQWFKVPLSSIQRIEVVRGGSSSLWGSLAVAGVINIITRKPTDDSTQLDLSYQSQNTSTAAISKNWTLHDGLALRISGNVLNTDGYQTTPAAFLSAVPGKGASSATTGNVNVAAYYQPRLDLSGFVRAGYHRSDEDVGGYSHGTNLQKGPDAAAGLTRFLGLATRLDVRLWTQFVSFDKYNGAGCFLAAPDTCNTSASGSPLVQYVNSHDANPYHEVGASALLTTQSLPQHLTNFETGIDYRTVGGEDDATTYNKPTATDLASATINRTNVGKGTQHFIGLFAQLGAQPFARFDAVLSMRYDYWRNVGGFAEMTKFTDGEPGPTSGGAIPDSHRGSFNPSLSLRYDATDRVSLRGAVYRSFRAPGLNNLYRSFSSTTFITIANPDLSPETLTGGEVGADFHARALTLGATAFQYDTRNLIASFKIPDAASAPAEVIAICGATLSDCPATVNFNTNGQNATSRGLELTGEWTVVPALALTGSYAYTDSHYTSTTTGDPTGLQLGAVPTHLATVAANWRVTPRFRVQGGARYNGSMFLDVNHTIPQSAFTLLDASTSFAVSPQLELYAAGTNLTNVHYSDNATTSAASATLGLLRSFTGGIRYRF